MTAGRGAAPRRAVETLGKHTMGLAGVVRGDLLSPEGHRCLEKGIHLCTRSRISSSTALRICIYLYTHSTAACTHTRVHSTLSRAHSTISFRLLYIFRVVVVGQILSEGIHTEGDRQKEIEKEREKEYLPVFRAYASISLAKPRQSPFFALPDGCTHPSDPSSLPQGLFCPMVYVHGYT